jgi:hypothetical protein
VHRSAAFPTAHTVDGSFDFAASVYAADVDGDGDVDVLGAAANANDITWWENKGGQFSLATTDVAQFLVSNSEIHDLLKIVATHEGRTGDSPVEFASLELRLTNGSGAALFREPSISSTARRPPRPAKMATPTFHWLSSLHRTSRPARWT